jgi:hypothetical protein
MTKKVIIICSLILLTSCSDSQLSEANISSANDTVMFKNEDLLQEVNEVVKVAEDYVPEHYINAIEDLEEGQLDFNWEIDAQDFEDGDAWMESRIKLRIYDTNGSKDFDLYNLEGDWENVTEIKAKGIPDYTVSAINNDYFGYYILIQQFDEYEYNLLYCEKNQDSIEIIYSLGSMKSVDDSIVFNHSIPDDADDIFNYSRH